MRCCPCQWSGCAEMMRCSLLFVAAAAALAGCAAPQPAIPSDSAVCVQSPEDAKRVVNVRRQLLTALNDGRLEAVIAIFDEKAVVVGPHAMGEKSPFGAIWTPALIREFFADRVMTPGYQFQLVGGQGVLAMDCNVAVLVGQTRVSLAGKEAEVTASMTLKKSGGTWRLWLLNLGELP